MEFVRMIPGAFHTETSVAVRFNTAEQNIIHT